jgi:sugar lactone lactonase YvrE
MKVGAVTLFDDRPCTLGEGIFWHPKRKAVFWFDIPARQLISRSGQNRRTWTFDEMVSAAGYVDGNRLVIAGENGLFLYDLETESSTTLAKFPKSGIKLRSNDGRADPYGGFWISTIGLQGEVGAAAIYRYFDDALTPLFDGLHIPNAICFAPDASYACFADTETHLIWKVALDRLGWPLGKPIVYIDLSAEQLLPDGAIIDVSGRLWVAHWGSGRVSCYENDGCHLIDIDVPSRNSACPAFGGPDLRTLYVSSARVGLQTPSETDGMTWTLELGATGQPEHRVSVKRVTL